jgi:hypothetical protein
MIDQSLRMFRLSWVRSITSIRDSPRVDDCGCEFAQEKE